MIVPSGLLVTHIAMSAERALQHLMGEKAVPVGQRKGSEEVHENFSVLSDI